MSTTYPHTVTLWNRLPEVDGSAVWRRMVLDETNFQERRGAQRWLAGDTSEDTVLVLIRWRSGYGESWSLADGDRIAQGIHADETPIEGAHVITAYDPVSLGAGIDHWEVNGT